MLEAEDRFRGMPHVALQVTEQVIRTGPRIKKEYAKGETGNACQGAADPVAEGALGAKRGKQVEKRRAEEAKRLEDDAVCAPKRAGSTLASDCKWTMSQIAELFNQTEEHVSQLLISDLVEVRLRGFCEGLGASCSECRKRRRARSSAQFSAGRVSPDLIADGTGTFFADGQLLREKFVCGEEFGASLWTNLVQHRIMFFNRCPAPGECLPGSQCHRREM